MRKKHTVIVFMFLSLICMSSSCSKETESKEDDTIIDKPIESNFIHGLDLSYVQQVEDKGGKYMDQNEEVDPYTLFKAKGANMVRLRLWHNPDWVKTIYGEETVIYNGFEEVASNIKRAKDNNLQVNLDFHYSDIWADPEHQVPPKAWQNISSIDVLCDSVYNYTYSIMLELHKRKLLPEMVQIGNETNCGMMHTETKPGFPNLSVCDGQWEEFGKVINAGIKAVRDIDALSDRKTRIALHVADPKNLDWWFTNLISKSKVTDFDIAGFSYYHIWHTEVSFSELPIVVSALINKIDKDVVVLETAYPFTSTNNDTYNNIYGTQAPIPGYAYSVEGQKQFMIDLTQNMMNAGAKGVMYWEPAWISSQMKDLWGTGSAWENCSLFDFSGNSTDAINYLQYEFKTD